MQYEQVKYNKCIRIPDSGGGFGLWFPVYHPEFTIVRRAPALQACVPLSISSHLKALVVNWHKPREKKALEHLAHGRVLWLDAMTQEGERISMIYIHQATARRPDLHRCVNTHIQVEMKKSEGRRRIMKGDLNAATSRTGYSISKKSHFEKVEDQFQEFIQRTGGSLIQSETHTRKDLMGGASLWWYQKCNTWPHHHMEFFQWWYGRNPV